MLRFSRHCVAAVAAAGALAAPAMTSAARIPSGIVDIEAAVAYSGGEVAGTGIVLSSSGEVLTNNHVVRGTAHIRVTDVDDRRTFAATVVGYDVAHDVAVLQLRKASDLAPARLASSSTVRIGQRTTAYGNAGGAGGTPAAAAGKVIALSRSITAREAGGGSERLTGLIETDAYLQAGDSGGPVVDANGDVIGMVTAGLAPSPGGASRGYAIPIDSALAVVGQVESGRSSGSVHVGPTPFLGVEVQPWRRALLVTAILDGGPAARAGLAPGDVLTHVGGRSVASADGLTRVVLAKRPGQRVMLRWRDSVGTPHHGVATLRSGPPL